MKATANIDHNKITILLHGYRITFVPDEGTRIHCVTPPWDLIGMNRETKAHACRYAAWIINKLFSPRKKPADRQLEMM
jgi:hypothetical protein